MIGIKHVSMALAVALAAVPVSARVGGSEIHGISRRVGEVKVRTVAPHPVARHAHVVVPAPRLVVRPSTVVVAAGGATIDMDISPEESRVYVDGRDRGEADDLDGVPGLLHIAPGTHNIRIVTPDGRVAERQVTLQPNQHVTVDLEL